MRRAVVVLAVAALSACAASTDWESRLDADHALAGRIWDVRAGRFVAPDVLIADLALADIVVLGEKHDNTDHQRLAAGIVGDVARRTPLGAVGFEILNSDRQTALDAARLDLGKFFSPYVRIADAARAKEARLIALNAPDGMVRDARIKGLASLDGTLVARLALDRPITAEVEEAIAKDMRQSHCGMLPESAIPGMVAVQRLWDAYMADRALAAPGSGLRALLIVGANHARQDRGVPAAIRRIAPMTKSTSVAFLEVVPGKHAPEHYGTLFDTTGPPFDYVWFTPRASADDPCAAFRRRPT